MIRSSRIGGKTTLLLLAAFAALMPATAPAGDNLPYRGVLHLNLTEVTEPDANFVVTAYGTLEGNANHLGKLEGEVVYQIDLLTGEFEGMAYKVAANGDILYESLEGQFDPQFITSTGTFSFHGGTGRFANASGDGTFSSVFTSETHALVDVDALLNYDASDRVD